MDNKNVMRGEKNLSPEWTTRHPVGSEFAPQCALEQSGLRALPR